ncbi:LuxR family transcriptional regulator [Streptomyces sp. NBC_00572]|uniref:helix-turn-helix transcriptional regulator n=1 Tax=Streptomyces sp. NBC_00572 TaxID=2903664 RepID=UPI002251ECBC|nr:LuxR family transcriptional regulator [Streptomyces sp. NBC_00572]MCX4986965.1 AAA family ATPase [Streptomyces sp. NBC_00572]
MTEYEAGRAAVPIGREEEMDRILRCLDVRSGPQGLLVLGETGSGRSRMLRFAEETAAARGALVLSVRGWGGERPTPFASLHQLLLPVQDVPDTVAEDWRQVLRSVVDRGAGAGPEERRTLCAATLALMTRLARSSQVMVAVDDAEDCDDASLEVLLSVWRRLTDQTVTMLFTARGEAPPAGVPADLPVLRLGPLSRGAAARLLDAQPHAPRGRHRLGLLRQAEGNPLAIVELNRASGVGAGSASLDSEAGRTLRTPQVFSARLDLLPEDTQRALLYASAALRDEGLRIVMAALGTDDLTVWAPAEEAGLIGVADGSLAFGHPLIRTAAFHRQPAKLRQQAHQDLATAVGQNPAYRAWHLAAAAIGPDEEVADALERTTAVHALRVGDRFASAEAFEQAARLSGNDEDRARRLAAAMVAVSDLGDPEWVRDLYAEFSRVAHDRDLRCVAGCATAAALSLLSYQREAFGLLLDVWRHSPPHTATTSLVLTALAAAIAHQSGLPEHHEELPRLFDHARRVAGAAVDRGDDRAERWVDALPAGRTDPVAPHPFPRLDGPGVLAALDASVAVGLDADSHGRSHRTPRRAHVPSSGPLGPVDGSAALTRLLAHASVAYYTDESEQCAELHRQASALHVARGAWGSRLWTLPHHVDTLVAMGRWQEAHTLIEEGRSAALVHPSPRVDMDLEALEVTLRALRGDSLPDIPFTGRHWRSVNLGENRATRVRMLRASGLHALALGDAEGAFRHLRALFGEDGTPLVRFLSPRCISELATAAQRVGRTNEAARVLGAVRESVGERPTTRMTLLMHHAAALVDEEADPEHHFRLALVNPEGDTWPLERAHARLHYAIWLRRRRRPLEARAQLTAVLEVAARLEARVLADAARGELRAAGVADASASTSDERLAELTAQQQQIARLAARGLSNREIAERLFLSPRTVGSHLYNVYPKLGVSSRHQLRDVLRDS